MRDNLTEPEGGGADVVQTAGGERGGGAGCDLSPDRTPTNEVPSMPLLSGKNVSFLILIILAIAKIFNI